MNRRIIVALTFSILCGRNEAQNGLSRAVGGTTPLRCLEKVDVGFCKALKPRFFYNEGSGRCELFYYGGCSGNRNRFDSLEECQSTCRSVDQNYINKSAGQGKDISRYPVWIQQERAAIPAKGQSKDTSRYPGWIQEERAAIPDKSQGKDISRYPVWIQQERAAIPAKGQSKDTSRYPGWIQEERAAIPDKSQGKDTSRYPGWIQQERAAIPDKSQGKDISRYPGWIQEERAAIPAKGLVCYSLRTCSLRCPYGRMVDRDGCELCMCKIFCDLDPCPSTYCPHGKAKDGNGCPICQCNPDPCYEFLCPPFQECQVVMDVTPNTYRAQCVQQATRPPCQPPNCVNKCPYDRTKADNNGCATCICWDPCEICKANEGCIVDQCVIRNDCRDYGVSCLAIDQPGRAASPVMPQTTTVASEVGLRLQEAMRKCCTIVGLVGTCLTTCETNSTLLFLDFPRCLPTSWTWSYLHCISAVDVMPKTTTVSPEVRQQTAMRKCCTTVRLVGTCLTTCETNSKLLLLDYTRCFPTSTSLIWDYVNCISVAQVDPTRWQPMVGRSSWLGGNIRSKRDAEQPNAADIPNENSSKNNGMKDETKRINAVPYLPS